MNATESYSQVSARLRTLTERSVCLVAVSKNRSVDAIRSVYQAGCRDFGENYVQEWIQKRDRLRNTCPGIRWHFIGQLQRNKLPLLVGEVLIHSLASLTHLHAIDQIAEKKGVVQECLLQLNVSGETSKGGIAPQACSAFLEAARPYQRVRLTGLMTFPPPTSNPQTNRPFFKKLRELRDHHALAHLSMGTSEDWEVAVEEGATLIRLGTILFGR